MKPRFHQELLAVRCQTLHGMREYLLLQWLAQQEYLQQLFGADSPPHCRVGNAANDVRVALEALDAALGRWETEIQICEYADLRMDQKIPTSPIGENAGPSLPPLPTRAKGKLRPDSSA